MWKLPSEELQDSTSIDLRSPRNTLPQVEHRPRILRREMTSVLFVTCVAKRSWSRGLWESMATTNELEEQSRLAQRRAHPESKGDYFLKSESSCRPGISLTCVAPLCKSNTKERGSRKEGVGKR